MVATTLGNSAGTATISFKFSGIIPVSYNTTIGSTVTDVATYPYYNDSPVLNNLKMLGTATATALTVTGNTSLNTASVSGNTALTTASVSGLMTSQNVIFCNNQVVNKMICLYDNDNAPTVTTGTNFNGFGVGNSTMRYQVPGGNVHRFYSGTTELANLSSSGLTLTGAPGLILPTSGGTATSLNYYEEYSYTTQFTNGYNSGAATTMNPAPTIGFVRIGKQVTMTISTLTFLVNNGSAANGMSPVTAPPSRFLPSNLTTGFASYLSASSYSAGRVLVNNTILINSYNALTVQTSTNSIIYQIGMSWTLF